MSKQLQANSIYELFTEQGDCSRKQIIQEIAVEVGVSPAYASTLYNNAKKATQPARHSAERNAQTTPTAPNVGDKINTFTKPTLRSLRIEMDAALKAVMDKHGISHKIGNMSFNGGEFTTSLTVSAGSQDEVIKNTFDLYCSDYGLKPSDLNREFTSNGKTFTITGIKPNRRKYPISGVGAQGGKYKFSAEQVVRGLV